MRGFRPSIWVLSAGALAYRRFRPIPRAGNLEAKDSKMALDLVYCSGDAEYSVRFTDAEWACIERYRTVAPDSIDTLFNTDAFGQPVPVLADELAEATAALLGLLKERPDLQPMAYQMRNERLPNSDQPDRTWQGGAVSGLRLPVDPDHFYMIRVGANTCQLTKVAVGPDGRGIILGTEDLRGQTQIQTETVGRVDFRARPAGAGLRKRLVAMGEFFASVSGLPVYKKLC
jgi:hypothetical protein